MPRARKSINQINVVPYIDVMLVLLVIFMVTAPLVAPGEIELPSVGSKLTVPSQPLEVRLNTDGSLSLRDRQSNTFTAKLTADEVIRRIKTKQEQIPDQPVVIEADRNARYEAVIHIIDLMQREQIKRVGLLARPPAK